VSLLVRGLDGSGEPDEHAAALVRAVLADGWGIQGAGTPDSVVVDELGLLTKGGAEGFLLMAAPTGETVTLKMLDGNLRAAPLVALHLLAQAGAISADDSARVGSLASPRITGGGRVVGRILPAF
jgi:L-asparaginase II